MRNTLVVGREGGNGEVLVGSLAAERLARLRGIIFPAILRTLLYAPRPSLQTLRVE